jgi:hypothetical protein
MCQSGEGVPRVVPTNDSRRFFVLYLDPVRSEQVAPPHTLMLAGSFTRGLTMVVVSQIGQSVVGLGFAERIDAYEFEELLQGNARNSAMHIRRTVSRSGSAALLEKTVSADGALVRQGSAPSAEIEYTGSVLRPLPLQQAQHQQSDEPLLPRHEQRSLFLRAAEFNAVQTQDEEPASALASTATAAAVTTARGPPHERGMSDRRRKGLSLPPNMQGWIKHE